MVEISQNVVAFSECMNFSFGSVCEGIALQCTVLHTHCRFDSRWWEQIHYIKVTRCISATHNTHTFGPEQSRNFKNLKFYKTKLYLYFEHHFLN